MNRPIWRGRKKKIPTRKEALGLLRSEGASKNVIAHCKCVCRRALSVARRTDRCDLTLIEAGALLHDLGRSKTHGIAHGVVGAQLIRRHNLPEKLARIVERHVGAGLTKKEASSFGLPPKDYLPRTPEERIVCYADKLIAGTKPHPYRKTRAEYAKLFGPNSAPVRRLDRLHAGMTAPIEKHLSEKRSA